MVRTFEAQADLPGGLQGDWDFLLFAYDTLNGRAPTSGWDIAYVTLHDAAGRHDVETIEEARESYEADGRGEVEAVKMTFHDVTEGEGRQFQCVVRARGGHVLARSLDETEVHGVVRTVDRRARDASRRRRSEWLRGLLLRDPEGSWWRLAYNPWVVGVGTALIAAAALAWLGLPG